MSSKNLWVVLSLNSQYLSITLMKDINAKKLSPSSLHTYTNILSTKIRQKLKNRILLFDAVGYIF